jgi:glycerol-3-phosphate O-acyltransferase
MQGHVNIKKNYIELLVQVHRLHPFLTYKSHIFFAWSSVQNDQVKRRVISGIDWQTVGVREESVVVARQKDGSTTVNILSLTRL